MLQFGMGLAMSMSASGQFTPSLARAVGTVEVPDAGLRAIRTGKECHERNRALQQMRFIRSLSSAQTSNVRAPASTFRKVVQGCGIRYQDLVTHFLIGYPVREQIEQQRVVGQLLGLLRRMWPVAAPYTALRRRLSVGTRDCARVRVRRRSNLGVGVGTRQLHPRTALVDQRPDLGEERMVHAVWLRDVCEMIKYDRRGNALFEDRHDLQDLGGRRVDLDV